MRVLNNAFDHPLDSEENAVMPLAGGIIQHGYQCGMIWGATLAAGAQSFQLFGPGPKAETMAIIAAQRLVQSFSTHYDIINCSDLTDIDNTSSPMQLIIQFLFKGGSIRCLHMAVKYARMAFREINIALSVECIEIPSPPVSCAAELARKMGLSEMHAVMAAGLAGGIGLCGGACGALGAAIWIMAMENSTCEDEKIEFKSTRAIDAINKFLNCTDFEFECANIVGRKFENINDHADYICNGGCSKVIQTIASA